ncbi:MAG TPA: SigE-dependent sporulation protein [Bacillus bacterium]|nr:SigE-dependent sporulation protein [Bacillus sp. (in: firmicutes)]
MLTLPWWIYLVLAGIIFSAFMMVKTAKEEQDVDMEFIEKEGEIYIQRMEEERARRKEQMQN